MTWLEALAQPVWRNLVFALLHTLWQGALLGLLLYVGLRCIPARRHNARYLLAMGLQLGLLVAGLTTWGVLNLGESRQQTANLASEESSLPARQVDQAPAARVEESALSRTAAPQPNSEFAASPANWVPWAAGLWVFGVALMLLRTVVSVMQARRLARGPAVTDAALLETMNGLRRELRIARRVRAVVCDACGSPAVLGIVWPTVVLPVSMLTGLSPESARAILAHELAHIRRHDYLLNLVQMLIESVLFFNPAVWWISRQVRNEREACCDALAVAITGEPVGYTQALADWAERVPGGAMPVAAAAWPGRGEKTLLDRVRRVLLPGYRPDVQVSWSGLIGLVVLGPLVLAGMWQGTTAAVALAAEILSPAERIEKLEAVQERYGKPDESKEAQEGKFTISGRVRVADGSALPAKAHPGGTLMKPSYSGSFSVDLDESGRFTKELDIGTAYLHVHAPDHAIAIAGPFTGGPDATIEDIDLVVSRGFAARIRFVDESGEPVAGVLLEEIDYRMPRENGWSGYSHPDEEADLRSDESGIVTLEKCSDWPVHIDARGSGYQFERRELKLEPGGTAVWQLAKARPTSGTVISETTGAPIAGARLYLAQRDGYANVNQDPRDWAAKPLLGVSDAQGRFRLDTLRDDSRYMIYVTAEGYGVELVRDVVPGQEHLEIALGPPLYIRGRLIGDLAELPRDYRTKEPYFHYRNPIRMLDHSGSYSALFRATVDVRDGEGIFEIRDLFPGFVQLTPPGRKVRLDLQEPIDDLTIDLTKPQDDIALENRPKRSVLLKFAGLADGVAPHGKLRVGYQFVDRFGTRGFQEETIDVTKQKVRTEAPVGSQFFYDGRQLLGYWIDNKSGIEVPEGESHLEITIPTIPAGAVYGRVLNPDGSPVKGCTVHAITVEKPPALKFNLMESVSVDRSDGRFVFSPVPLGGRYRFLASEQGSQARQLSEILVLDDERPLHEIELRLADGVPLRGKVLGPNGSPVSAARVSFGYSSDGHSFGDADVTTDGEGRFVFERVNPGIPGRYSLTIRPTDSLRGQHFEVGDPAKEIVVRMRPGEHLRGVLLDSETSEPIGEAKVTAWIADFRNVEYGAPIETRADAEGRFAFGNLEPTIYRLKVDGGEAVRINPAYAESRRHDDPVVRAGESAAVEVFVDR